MAFDRRSIRETVAALESLVSDLRHLAAGGEVAEETLVDAPLLVSWELGSALTWEPILVGYVVGHPLLADGPCRTSRLFAVADDRSFARTFSRWYRLGPPARTTGALYDA